MTMTEQKLQILYDNYDKQKQTGWYLCRLGGIPGMSSKGAFNRVVRARGYQCVKCGSVNPFLTVDHIVRRVEGGTHDVTNLQLLCRHCHQEKDNAVRVRKS